MTPEAFLAVRQLMIDKISYQDIAKGHKRFQIHYKGRDIKAITYLLGTGEVYIYLHGTNNKVSSVIFSDEW